MKKADRETAVASKLLSFTRHNLDYYVGGLENAELDGHITAEEFEQETTQEKLLDQAQGFLQEAYRTGVYQKENTFEVIEAKHLKFLGNEKIQELLLVAVLITIDSI